MAVVIQNISSPDVPDDALNSYVVRINNTRIATFEHRRDEGLAVCLEKAAAAVRAASPDNFERQRLAAIIKMSAQ